VIKGQIYIYIYIYICLAASSLLALMLTVWTLNEWFKQWTSPNGLSLSWQSGFEDRALKFPPSFQCRICNFVVASQLVMLKICQEVLSACITVVGEECTSKTCLWEIPLQFKCQDQLWWNVDAYLLDASVVPPSAQDLAKTLNFAVREAKFLYSRKPGVSWHNESQQTCLLASPQTGLLLPILEVP